MNKDTVYWVWLQRAIGYGSLKTEIIASTFSFAEDFYRLPYTEKLELGCFTKSEAAKLKNTSLIEAENIVKICIDKNIDIVALGDRNYPSLLRKIPAPPAVLYTRGRIETADEHFCVSMVGTRNATQTGKKYAREIARDLAKENICIISGGAKGIDHYSHLGALDAGGSTICVLGCGHEVGYLREFDSVKQDIINRGGAVISEFPPYDPPSRITFPIRNRIISGLSRGVVVVEAGQRSGSSITAGTALEQGRDVFALADEISEKSSEGTRQLIYDGAIPIVGAVDIMVEYLGAFPEYRERVLMHAGADSTDFEAIKKRIGSLLGGLGEEECAEAINAILNSRSGGGYDIASDELRDELSAQRTRPDFLSYFDEVFLLYRQSLEAETTEPEKKQEKKGRSEGNTAENEAPEPKQKKKRSAKGGANKRETQKKEGKSLYEDVKDAEAQTAVQLSPSAETLLTALRGGAMHIDKMAEKTALPISAIHAAVMELELNDLIEMTPGRVYQIKSH